MTHASLCSGLGAPDLAAAWLGWENGFWCEIDDFCRTVLKYWFPSSIDYEDITKQSFREWRYRIDVLTAGFPCQPFSISGKRKGADDYRYLWPAVKRTIREVRPPWFVGENVDGITSMVLAGKEVKVEGQANIFEEGNKETILEEEYVINRICSDLEREGYSVQPFIIPACSVGAPHQRDRVFFVAYSDRNDARRRRYRETGSTSGALQGQQKEWERLRNVVKRNGAPEVIAYSDCQRQSNWNSTHGGREISYIQERIQDYRKSNGLCSVGDASYSDLCGWLQNYQDEFAKQLEQGIPDWRRFPTQSPICGRNDGIPGLLDSLTFSSWRRNGVKGFGNAIVPQEIFEILKTIGIVSDLQIP